MNGSATLTAAPALSVKNLRAEFHTDADGD